MHNHCRLAKHVCGSLGGVNSDDNILNHVGNHIWPPIAKTAKVTTVTRVNATHISFSIG
jgi:hypothetical protein